MITAQYRCKACMTTFIYDVNVANLLDAGDTRCPKCDDWLDLVACERCRERAPALDDLCGKCVAKEYLADPKLLAVDRQIHGGNTWWPNVERWIAAELAENAAERRAERIAIVESMTAAPL